MGVDEDLPTVDGRSWTSLKLPLWGANNNELKEFQASSADCAIHRISAYRVSSIEKAVYSRGVDLLYA